MRGGLLLPLLALLPAHAADVVVVDTRQGPIEVRPVVTGGRDAGSVLAALQPHLPAIGDCFRISLVGIEPFHLAFTVDAAGKPASADVRPPTVPSTEACVRDVVLGVTFPDADAASDLRLGLVRAPDASSRVDGIVRPAPGAVVDPGATAPYAPASGVNIAPSTVIVGALDKKSIDAVVRAALPTMQACYAEAKKASPTLGGRIVVKFTIDGTGAVTSATLASSTVPDDDLDVCVTRVFAGLRFPAPRRGGIVIASYPLDFVP